MNPPFQPQDADQRYQFLTEALPIYFWTGEGNRYEFCNRHLLEFTGLSMDAIQAGAAFQLVHPDDRERVIAATRHSLKTGQPLTEEYRIRRADGQYRWHLARSGQFRDSLGRLKWVGIAIDITDRKLAEEELRTANQRLILALSTAQMGDWEWDVETGRIWWSDIVHRMHGFEPGTFDGRFECWASTIHPEDRSTVLDALGKASAGQGEYDVEYRTVRPDGSVYWTHARAVIQRHVDGRPQRWLGVCMDITNRKLSEQAMQQAEKLAAVGRLAASIAHEINNPLESVTNLLFLLETHKDLPTSLRDYITTAQRELGRISQIATQTLRFYRQSGAPSLTEIPALIESVLSLYQGRLSNADVTLIRDIRSTVPLLCSDGELRQILTNLVGNALDAMGDRGGRLIIRSRIVTGDGEPRIRISVADTGAGISADQRHRIFQAFFTTKPTGTGLGLWITQELVRKQGGRIALRSRSGQGSVFTVSLPAKFPAETTLRESAV